MSRRFVLVANPANRRAAYFQAALARAGLPAATVVPWLELVRGSGDLTAHVFADSVVRFDSPGEDDEVERALIALGADASDPEGDDGMSARVAARAALDLPRDHGRILHPRQWYLGFAEALRRCGGALAAAPPHLLINAPEDIAVMFDKRACHARLSARDVPVPTAIVGPRVRGWEDLRARMADAGLRRVFVKLACGSSASGVVALDTGARGVVAHTTVELVQADDSPPRLYNALRVRRYTDERQLATIIDALCREGAHVESWLPKAGLAGRTLDLRVVVFDARARQVVVRTSEGPLTNLHLGNQRGDPEAVRARLGEQPWLAALGAAEAALRAFPRTRYAGVDLLIGSDWKRHAVLEVNAFGDFVHGPLTPTEAAKVSPWSDWLSSL